MSLARAFWLFYSITGGWPQDHLEIPWLLQRYPDEASFSRVVQTLAGQRTFGPAPGWVLQMLSVELGSSVGYLANAELARIVLEAAGNAWGEDKTRAAIESTEWWRVRTERERSWPRLSEGERQLQVTEQAVRYTNALRSIWGPAEFDRRWPGGASHPDIRTDAELFASGRVAFEFKVFEHTTWAESVEGTPAQNALVEQRRQAGAMATGIEDLQARLEQVWREWMGDQVPTPANMAEWANNIFMNQNSQADFEKFVKDESSALYPNKPRELSFRLWVGRPKALIQDMLELGVAEDNDPLLVSYARGEISLADLESRLRRDHRFEGTQRAQQEGRAIGLGLSQAMGF